MVHMGIIVHIIVLVYKPTLPYVTMSTVPALVTLDGKAARVIQILMNVSQRPIYVPRTLPV